MDNDKKLCSGVNNVIIINYELALSLVPHKLKNEFKEKILPWSYIQNDVLPSLNCNDSEIRGKHEHIKRTLATRFGLKGFGLRCEALGRLPEEIFAELIRGVLSIEV